MPTVGTSNQGGKHGRKRLDGLVGNPFCYGNYWADLLSGFNRVLFIGVIEEGNDQKNRHQIDYRAVVYVAVSHKQLHGLQNR